jgi:cell division protein FtsB
MVTRRKLRSFLSALGLYVAAAGLIGYFGVNAYTGDRGLRAKQDLDQQFTEQSAELGRLKQERVEWQRRVALLKSESIDRTRWTSAREQSSTILDPRDLTLMLKRP